MARRQQGVQSIEIGLGLLRVLAAARTALPLKELAAGAGMAPAKAHRYMVSFIRAGLVEQDGASGRYDLGPAALELGLAALDRIDAIKVGTEAINALRERINETVLLAVWGTAGPTIVRWVESTRPVTVNVRAGSVLPVTRSATGRVFLAWLPPETTRPWVERETRRPREAVERHAVATRTAGLAAATRAAGLGSVEGDMLAGISALAAPVFNHAGALTMVIATLGPHGVFDAALDGATARALRACAVEASRRLGAPAQASASGAGLPSGSAPP